MVERPQRSAAKKLTLIGVISALMIFGDWLIEKTQHTPEVTELRFVRESTAVRADFNQILIEIRQSNLQLTETNQRLREICERLRAGCR